jgi:hypothetical protein
MPTATGSAQRSASGHGDIDLTGFKIGMTGKNGNLAAFGSPNRYGGAPTMRAFV